MWRTTHTISRVISTHALSNTILTTLHYTELKVMHISCKIILQVNVKLRFHALLNVKFSVSFEMIIAISWSCTIKFHFCHLYNTIVCHQVKFHRTNISYTCRKYNNWNPQLNITVLKLITSSTTHFIVPLQHVHDTHYTWSVVSCNSMWQSIDI